VSGPNSDDGSRPRLPSATWLMKPAGPEDQRRRCAQVRQALSQGCHRGCHKTAAFLTRLSQTWRHSVGKGGAIWSPAWRGPCHTPPPRARQSRSELSQARRVGVTGASAASQSRRWRCHKLSQDCHEPCHRSRWRPRARLGRGAGVPPVREIQGDRASSPRKGQIVTACPAVVRAVYRDGHHNLDGFFFRDDDTPATRYGIFVYAGWRAFTVAPETWCRSPGPRVLRVHGEIDLDGVTAALVVVVNHLDSRADRAGAEARLRASQSGWLSWVRSPQSHRSTRGSQTTGAATAATP
jgi:hypothetical protein